MILTVSKSVLSSDEVLSNQAVLVPDSWDDWFRYNTTYILFFYDHFGKPHRIGEVKIGEFDMKENQARPKIPNKFEKLSDRFFSLGQDASYYEKLKDLEMDIGKSILIALNDVAFNKDLFEIALSEDVMGVSLLRSVSRQAVRGQFRRMAHGGARLTDYAFEFLPQQGSSATFTDAPVFSFNVTPDSTPPTNIHVLIGRNGVGKSYTLNNMANSLVNISEKSEYGIFSDTSIMIADSTANNSPENIVSVSFSAFDNFQPITRKINKSEGIRYHYIGLKYIGTSKGKNQRTIKSPSDLGRDFGTSVTVIGNQKSKLAQWHKCLRILDSDPIFKEAGASSLPEISNLEELKTVSSALFRKMSSGHKIVLLTITKLVETVEEKTLVLLDEPEAHLHPPLLSAFIRTLSQLLIDRNGVGIVATHSPVVLQEVPQSCVWIIRRSGHEVVIERPSIETFGENVSVLTTEVFGLEVSDSGFYKLLNDEVNLGKSYDAIVEEYSNQIGTEARVLLKSLTAIRDGIGR